MVLTIHWRFLIAHSLRDSEIDLLWFASFVIAGTSLRAKEISRIPSLAEGSCISRMVKIGGASHRWLPSLPARGSLDDTSCRKQSQKA